jgi:hypothetical protein
VSKISVPKKLVPAVGVFAIAVVAIAAIAIGSGRLPAHNGSVTHSSAVAARPAPAATPQQRARVRASMDALPLAFEANQGQTDSQVKYLARGNGYTVFLTANDAVFALQSAAQNPAARAAAKSAHRTQAAPAPQKQRNAAIDMKLVGGNRHPQIAAGTELPGRTNYFIGNDSSKWQRDVKQYSTVSYKQVYPGVDMLYHGQQRQLEFDFVVAPGASAGPIRFNVDGARRIATDAQGNLVLSSAAGDVLLHKPVAYQQKENTRQPVDARFTLEANNTVSFELGNYDRSRELVIDPSLVYSTYLGGTAEDDAYGIAIDSSDNVYVTGQTASTNFPTVHGSYSTTNAGGATDVFVTKISASGASLLYSTYVGGSGADSGNGIAVDASGDAFVTGGTGSTDFPTTAGAFQTTYGGGQLDAFVFELNSSGTTLTYSTYVGGSGSDYAYGVTVDGSGSAYVVGATYSTNFPTHNPIQSTIAGTSNGFVTKLNASGNALVYSTYLGGGSGDFAVGVALDSSDNAYVAGVTENSAFPTTTGAFQTTCGSCGSSVSDAFVSVINAAGSGFVYSTFLGGSGIDQGLGIAVDSSGDAYVTGLTQSSNFPVKSALQSTLATGATQNAFVAELNPTGAALMYSTYLGGGQSDAGTGIALDESGYAYVTGNTSSSNFPTAGPTQSSLGGDNDAFVSELGPGGSPLIFSTYLGGSLDENTNVSGGNLAALGAIAVASTGANIYIAGNTASQNFPVASAYQASYGGGVTDSFVAQFSQTGHTSPDYTLQATTPTAVSAGSSTTSTVTLISVQGYASAVNLTCSVTAVSGSGAGTPLPTCSFTNASVTPTSSGATSTLNINTTGSTNSAALGGNGGASLWLPVVGISLLGIPFASAKSGRRKLFGLLTLSLALCALFVLPSCGGSSNSGGGGGHGTSGTPAGSYTVAVTGAGTDSNTTTHSTSVTLTVN